MQVAWLEEGGGTEVKCPHWLKMISEEPCYCLHILALIETGLSDRVVLEVAEAEKLEGTELAVLTEADLKTEVPDGCRFRCTLLLNVCHHLVEWHVQQAGQPFTLCRTVVEKHHPDGAAGRCIDGFLGE